MSVATAYALVDCNNFFASCEAVFRPEWRERPLVVAGSNDGVVIARSPAAKGLGIPMGAPLHSVRPLLEQHRVVVCSANFALYADLSCRVMDTLGHFTERLEVASVDEAFLDFAAGQSAQLCLRDSRDHWPVAWHPCLARSRLHQDTGQDCRRLGKAAP